MALFWVGLVRLCGVYSEPLSEISILFYVAIFPRCESAENHHNNISRMCLKTSSCKCKHKYFLISDATKLTMTSPCTPVPICLPPTDPYFFFPNGTRTSVSNSSQTLCPRLFLTFGTDNTRLLMGWASSKTCSSSMRWTPEGKATALCNQPFSAHKKTQIR